jgi:hypothetical protein
MATRWYWRLGGHRTPEDAMDEADALGATRALLYAQPSVPVCGTVEILEGPRYRAAALDDLVAEARRLEEAARELRALAERLAAGEDHRA